MAKINLLDIETINKIAAGEVVERPASVVKELVENSVDAGAKSIIAEIKNGGLTYIRITDNGCGIAADEVETAFLPHSTSKIKSIDDLSALYTMGFRGEALASISSVSNVEIITKTADEDAGTAMSLSGGKIISKQEAGCPDGTTIIVKDLFFNTPARMNFMKKDMTEYSHVKDVIERMILGHPDISFRLINNGREVLFSSGNGNTREAFAAVYGRELAGNMIDVNYDYDGIRVYGLTGIPYSSRPNRNMQNLYVNKRWVRSKTVTHAAEEAYKTRIMTGQFPVFMLNVDINSAQTDINVHPAKLEIKFSDERKIHSSVFWAVQNALLSSRKEKEADKEVKVESETKQFVFEAPKPVENPAIAFSRQKDTVHFQPVPKNTEMFTKEFVEIFKKDEPVPTFENVTMEEVEAPVQDKTPDIPVKEDYKICGQIFDTYIIIEKDEKMLLIDQHAAHERINYEKLVGEVNIVRQTLMFPETVYLTTKETALLKENMGKMEKIGFDISEFGNNEFIVREIPEHMLQENIQNTVTEILQLIEENADPNEWYSRALFTVACKSAIKANHKLSESEMKELCDRALFDEKIRTCPHGRPIIISFSKKYIEKEFKRIV